MNALVTGGAGFIGSHLVDRLVREGWEVKILDNLAAPTHRRRPAWINRRAEFLRADIREPEAVRHALRGVDIVFHLAAVGGFQNEFVPYVDVNCRGTALLIEKILASRRRPKVVYASSQAVYGEGLYECPRDGAVQPQIRRHENVGGGRWEPACPRCAGAPNPLPTPEETPPSTGTPYGLSKLFGERLVISLAHDRGLAAVALRFFLTYGPRQSLTNPYTGICSIFAGLLRRGRPPEIFEDGLQTRDFLYVGDLVEALWLAARCKEMEGEVFNVGTGRPTTVLDFARTLGGVLGKSIAPRVSETFRQGDMRHLVADTRKIHAHGFTAKVPLEEGLRSYAEWFAKISKSR